MADRRQLYSWLKNVTKVFSASLQHLPKFELVLSISSPHGESTSLLCISSSSTFEVISSSSPSSDLPENCPLFVGFRDRLIICDVARKSCVGNAGTFCIFYLRVLSMHVLHNQFSAHFPGSSALAHSTTVSAPVRPA